MDSYKQDRLIKGILAALEQVVKTYSKSNDKSEKGKNAITVLKYVMPGAKAFIDEFNKQPLPAELAPDNIPDEDVRYEEIPEVPQAPVETVGADDLEPSADK